MGRTLYLTGLEPSPVARGVDSYLSQALDKSAKMATELLSERLTTSYQRKNYQLRSCSLFYQDWEEDSYNYAGWRVLFLSPYDKPTVHCYGFELMACWNGRDATVAEDIRCEVGLKRYVLFTRHGPNWQFSHAGQLPIIRR